MGKVFLIDVAKCNGCRNCQVACKDEHCEQPWLPYAAAQPLTGQFWCKVNEKERGRVPVVKVSYTPTMCNHCAEASCMAAAPDAVYRRDDGLVIIDPEKAKGKKEVVDACPIGAIYWNEGEQLPQKCTGCAHLLDDGWEVPRCVDACPTEALRYVDESEVDMTQVSVLEGMEGMGARAYYLNLPKRFVAGTVIDAQADEVIIGATVELLGEDGSIAKTQRTDEFGDFMFDQVEKAAYQVRVKGKTVDADAREADVVVDDIDVA